MGSYLRPFFTFLTTFTFLLINTMVFFIIHGYFVFRRFPEKLGALVIIPSLIALTVWISSLPNLPLPPRLRHKINSFYAREHQLKRYIAYTSSWFALAAFYWLFLYVTDLIGRKSLFFQRHAPTAFALIAQYVRESHDTCAETVRKFFGLSWE